MKNFRKKPESLDKLLSKFYSPEQAEQIKGDFLAVDNLFEKFPNAAPSQQTIKDIKQKIAVKLAKPEPIKWSAVLLKTAAVAAVIIFAAVITTVDQKKTQPIQYATAGQINQPDEIDAEILMYENQISLLKDELLAINLGEYNGTNGVLLEETEQTELEIIEIDNSFWKG